MQNNHENPDKSATRPRLARTRIVEMNHASQTTGTHNRGKESPDHTGNPVQQRVTPAAWKATQANPPSSLTIDSQNGSSTNQSTTHLMQLSGMIRAIRKTDVALNSLTASSEEDGYWPLGIQQAGPLPIVNVYGRASFGRTLPTAIPLVTAESIAPDKEQKLPAWRRVLASPTNKIVLGLVLGLALFFLTSLFIDLPTTLTILGTHLSTAQSIGLALLAGIVYLSGHSIRGLRWKFLLNPWAIISKLTIIELYQVATFLNFLLPIRAGEASKSLALKRVANVPVSKSLPTVAMDKSLDLLSILIVLPLAPLLGISMTVRLWLVLVLASGVLLSLAVFIGLTGWKRSFAISLLQKLPGLLPRSISSKIEGFVTGFTDALLAAASRPQIFLPALLLTGLAILCDGLCVMLAFGTLGYSLSFGVVLYGYTVCRLFSILPTPPGQVGSNEAVGLLVFSALLGLPGNQVLAMYLFWHIWTALLLTAVGLSSLAALGLTITTALHIRER
ncbi:MAG TPA: lysylphosphatidylglycerol synthase transmembrane domain-containing protein [Ktedonobacteraceae bacterium]|nr:lysylphosphatidylglycerol synthase transmembrane domain-containing protein [Ktedonobacteraceae bacterium]